MPVTSSPLFKTISKAYPADGDSQPVLDALDGVSDQLDGRGANAPATPLGYAADFVDVELPEVGAEPT